jgi:xylan 1,4-beta-xylosidase
VFLTNVDTPDSYPETGPWRAGLHPEGECITPRLRPAVESPGESIYDPRGWSTLGRETAIQKVYWDDEGWPRIEAVTAGKPSSAGRKTPSSPKAPAIIASRMTLLASARPELEYPAGAAMHKMGTTGDGN